MKFQKLADNLGLELEDYLELVELFIEISLTDLDKINEAIENKNPDKAASAIHSIKGAAGNLGFMEIYETAQKLEAEARNSRLDEIAEPINQLKATISEIADQAVKP